MTARDHELVPDDLDRIYALEDETRQLRRDLEGEQEERRALARRLLRAEERLGQVESDVKDAHDRAQNAEDRIAIVEDVIENLDLDSQDEEPIDERELGESGA